MKPPTPPRAEAPARVLAMIVAANGLVDDCELRALDELDAFARLDISRERFVELAAACAAEVGTHLCECSWLCAEDLRYLDALLDAVPDPEQRALVCRLGAVVMKADGRETLDERLVYDHALARWHISEASASLQPLSRAP